MKKLKNKIFFNTFKYNSIFIQYVFRNMLLVMIPILILCCIIGMLYLKNIYSYIDSAISQNFTNTVHNLTQKINEAKNLSQTLLKNEDFNNIIFVSPHSSENYYTTETKKNIMTFITDNCSYNENIEAISIYSAVTDYVYSSTGSDYYEYFSESDAIREVISRFQNGDKNLYYLLNNKNKSQIDLCCVKFSRNTLQSIIVITVNMDDILRITENSVFDFIALSDEKQFFITSDNKKKTDELNIFDFGKHKGFVNFIFKKHIALRDSLDIFDLKLTVDYPLLSFKNIIYTTWLVIFLCLILSLVIPLLISVIISVKYYNTITDIAVKFQDGILKFEDDSTKNEISYIFSAIENMNDKVTTIEKDLAKNFELIRKFQTIALQSQINPHFIGNTLNSINVYLMSKSIDCDEVTDMISGLSYIITDVFRSSKYISTIAEELEYLKKYLMIEQIKNTHLFETEYELDSSLMGCKTLKMILQPIAENALNHGIFLLPDDKKGLLRVWVSRQNDCLLISIADNGYGFSEEKEKELLEAFECDELPNGRHIGLLNINTRIRLLFGAEYGVSIGRKNDLTVITVKIPIILDDNDFLI